MKILFIFFTTILLYASPVYSHVEISAHRENLGKTMWHGTYKNHKRHGTWVQKTSNGSTIRILNYKNGLLDGESRVFYKNGRVAKKLHFIDGKLDGRLVVEKDLHKSKSIYPVLLDFKADILTGGFIFDYRHNPTFLCPNGSEYCMPNTIFITYSKKIELHPSLALPLKKRGEMLNLDDAEWLKINGININPTLLNDDK